jgi:hypothetical protein
MKAYLLVTGALFGLITLVHLWRIFFEAVPNAREPWFILLTVLTAALCGWAVRLLRVAGR